MTVLVAMLPLLMAGLMQTPPVRAGVWATSGDTAVVAVEGPLLATGTPVTIIGLKHPQQVVQATIARRLDRSDLMAKHSLSGPFYEVRTEAASPRPDLGVVIVGRATARTSQDSVSVRIDGGGAELRVRSCTSSEGLHLTVWLGIPLQSARLWHQYYYLGYDTEPTCTRADTEPTTNGLATPESPISQMTFARRLETLEGDLDATDRHGSWAPAVP